jgi:hypothetical protein
VAGDRHNFMWRASRLALRRCCDPHFLFHLRLEFGRTRGPDDEAIEVQ